MGEFNIYKTKCELLKKINIVFLFILISVSTTSCRCNSHLNNGKTAPSEYGSTYDSTSILPEIVPDDAKYVDQTHPAADDGNTGTEDQPYLTISGALVNAIPGDTIVVKEGTYRESISLPGGDDSNPLTLMSYPGHRVVVTRMSQISGWVETSGGIWIATIDWKPLGLYVGNREQIIAREPNEGWWAVEAVQNIEEDTGECIITDTENLIGFSYEINTGVPEMTDGVDGEPPYLYITDDKACSEAHIWTVNGNTIHISPIVSLNNSTGDLTLFKKSQWMTLTADAEDGSFDRYWLQNSPAFIDRPGEWAIEETGDEAGDRYRIYFMPDSTDDLNSTQAPLPDEPRVIFCNNVNNVRIIGIEVTGSIYYGIQISESENITVFRSSASNNGRYGISVRDSSNIIVKQNVSFNNNYGIVFSGTSGALVEMNEIAYNKIDGLIVSWGSDNITVRKNYIHHHLKWGHPDNMQLYRGVTNISIIENLLIAGGQSIMMEETSFGEIMGNTIIGSGAYSVILGHDNASDYMIIQNSIILARYGCLSLTADHYEIRDNVIVKGNEGSVYSVRDLYDYTGDRNLFYNADGAGDGILITSEGWNRPLEEYQNLSGQELNSFFGNPVFESMPYYFCEIDLNRIHECTRDTIFLGSTEIEWFEIGDIIELNFDGIGREITGVTNTEFDNSITFIPEYSEKPVRHFLIMNWRDGLSELDSALQLSSPGQGMSSSGGAVGSTIEIQAYKDGDFDGDGLRDIPLMFND